MHESRSLKSGNGGKEIKSWDQCLYLDNGNIFISHIVEYGIADCLLRFAFDKSALSTLTIKVNIQLKVDEAVRLHGPPSLGFWIRLRHFEAFQNTPFTTNALLTQTKRFGTPRIFLFTALEKSGRRNKKQHEIKILILFHF